MFTPKFIDPLEYAGSIAKALDPGVLLTTRAKMCIRDRAFWCCAARA